MVMVIQLPAWSEDSFALSAEQATALSETGLVRVLLDAPGRWKLASDSRVGVVLLSDGLELRVVPRLEIPQLMFLLSYSQDSGWGQTGPLYAVDEDLFTAVAAAFALHAERAILPTPLRGYVAVEECGTVLRGRLRVGQQLARWPGRSLPLEIAHDDYTADIAENQLLRGAAELLLQMPVRTAHVRQRLLRIRSELEDVYPTPPAVTVDSPAQSRLNLHYGPALRIATLILRGTSIAAQPGSIHGVSFVFDMNRVFEQFLTLALTHALERQGGRLLAQQATHLDRQRGIRLVPDLTWWRHGACRTAIDAKYKALASTRFPNADAYQMLAYCTALAIDHGYLVYAKDAIDKARDHTIDHTGKTLHVRTIDVEQRPATVLAEVADLAREIARQDIQTATTK